jgi:hypothetical protein
MKQQFKTHTLTHIKTRNNILRVWEICSDEEKNDWYSDANRFSVLHGNGEVSKMCGYISALSPLKTWEQNKRLALDYINGLQVGHFGSFVRKCDMIKQSNGTDEEILAILNGNKTQSFYLNIRHPHKGDNVTIDRHAISIAMGYTVEDSYLRGITDNQYSFFVACYRMSADKVDVSPTLMQSATWQKWRKIKRVK